MSIIGFLLRSRISKLVLATFFFLDDYFRVAELLSESSQVDRSVQ